MSIASKELLQKQAQLFLEIVAGDKDALAFVYQIVEVADTWDNLLDGDVCVEEADLRKMLWHALVDFPLNPFYRKHCDLLTPVIASSIMTWEVANAYEKSGSREKLLRAHTLRYMPLNIVMTVCLICNGPSKTAKIGERLWDIGQPETFEEYLKDKSYANNS